MSSFTSNFDSIPAQAGTYFANVLSTAVAFFTALCAVKPLPTGKAVTREVVISPRAKQKNRRELLRMANQYDAMMPSFSAELRSFACRD